LGHEIPDRVSGVELVERLCALSEELGFSIFFLGGAPGIAALAAKNLKDKYPKMVLAGSRDGYFKKSEDIEIANEVALLLWGCLDRNYSY
jgi:N-acetylglucosaminyldiphosphoundecaprenol N-acetyl-beta-D-mannosaminyltransferase